MKCPSCRRDDTSYSGYCSEECWRNSGCPTMQREAPSGGEDDLIEAECPEFIGPQAADRREHWKEGAEWGLRRGIERGHTQGYVRGLDVSDHNRDAMIASLRTELSQATDKLNALAGELEEKKAQNARLLDWQEESQTKRFALIRERDELRGQVEELKNSTPLDKLILIEELKKERDELSLRLETAQKELAQEVYAARAAENARLRTELVEQARLVGMGAERELKLLTELRAKAEYCDHATDTMTTLALEKAKAEKERDELKTALSELTMQAELYIAERNELREQLKHEYVNRDCLVAAEDSARWLLEENKKLRAQLNDAEVIHAAMVNKQEELRRQVEELKNSTPLDKLILIEELRSHVDGLRFELESSRDKQKTLIAMKNAAREELKAAKEEGKDG